LVNFHFLVCVFGTHVVFIGRSRVLLNCSLGVVPVMLIVEDPIVTVK